MAGDTGPQKRELEIPADTARLHDAREWAAEVAHEFGMPEDDCFQVKLAMSEAVTNAIIHGSGAHHDAVRIVAARVDGSVAFEVADRGRPADADPAERLSEGGRGLELVSMVMDEVSLIRGDEGGRLRFSKRLHAAA